MSLLKSVIIAILMLISAGLAIAITPIEYIADSLPAISLKDRLPARLGDWSEVAVHAELVIDPTQQEVINELYSETLARSYVNKDGYVVMLSIAYGKSQQDGVEVHTPDICYPAQGFEITKKEFISIDLKGSSQKLPVKKLITSKESRAEPLIYWTILGNYVYQTHLQKKYYDFKYSLDKKIADGMIIRISSIDMNDSRALEMQKRFVQEMYANTPVETRDRFFGKLDGR